MLALSLLAHSRALTLLPALNPLWHSMKQLCGFIRSNEFALQPHSVEHALLPLLPQQLTGDALPLMQKPRQGVVIAVRKTS